MAEQDNIELMGGAAIGDDAPDMTYLAGEGIDLVKKHLRGDGQTGELSPAEKLKRSRAQLAAHEGRAAAPAPSQALDPAAVAAWVRSLSDEERQAVEDAMIADDVERLKAGLPPGLR